MKLIILILFMLFSCSNKGYLSNNADLNEGINKKNRFTSLKKALKKPQMVYELDLSNQGLGELPNNIGNLNKLQRLILSNNELNEFPKEICKIESITHLMINNCNLTDIPDCISNLQNLEFLWLMHNGEINLPQSIKELKKLRQLNLAYNAISEEELAIIKSNVPKNCRVLYYH